MNGEPDTTWRVANWINHAAHQWQNQLDRDFNYIEEGRVDVQLALMLIACAHRQGLAPHDLDTPEGLPALRALAYALAADRALRQRVKSDIVWAAYGGTSTLLTGAWAEVRRMSAHLLEHDPCRYSVEYQ